MSAVSPVGTASWDATGWRTGVSRLNAPLLGAALLMLVLLGAFALMGIADQRSILGVGAWVKPAKFAASLGLHFLTLAVLWRWAGTWQAGWVGSVLTRLVIASGLFEVAYIAFRASRGEISHYNLETPLAALMFQLMGVGATILVLAPAVAGLAAWRAGATADPLGRAVTLGLVLSGVLSLVTGGILAAHGSHFVGAPAAGASTWPIVGWSMTVGDLRPAHFVALHTLQFLPVAGWLIARTRPGPGATRIVDGLALALVGLCVGLLLLARAGKPLGL